jgi:uncharacterized protein
MQGMRLLLLIAAIVGIFLIVRTLLLSNSRRKAPAPERLKEQGTVVRCAHCGMHVPQFEAYRSGDRMYCSREHALEDARNHQDG